jgi:hypothetical protein
MIPRLRAILQDSMVIRKTLQDLEELGSLTAMIDETCQLIRDDNHTKMESALIGTLKRSVISEAQIKHMENSATRSHAFKLRVEATLLEVGQTQQTQAKRLADNAMRLGQLDDGILGIGHVGKE